MESILSITISSVVNIVMESILSITISSVVNIVMESILSITIRIIQTFCEPTLVQLRSVKQYILKTDNREKNSTATQTGQTGQTGDDNMDLVICDQMFTTRI